MFPSGRGSLLRDSHLLSPSVYPQRGKETLAFRPGALGFLEELALAASSPLASSVLRLAASSAPRSFKAVNFSFTRPFIQCILSGDCVPGLVSEASTPVKALAPSVVFRQSLRLLCSPVPCPPKPELSYLPCPLDLGHLTDRVGSRWPGRVAGCVVHLGLFCLETSTITEPWDGEARRPLPLELGLSGWWGSLSQERGTRESERGGIREERRRAWNPEVIRAEVRSWAPPSIELLMTDSFSS